MTKEQKEEFYTKFKDYYLCKEFCGKAREWCCPDIIGQLCKLKRDFLEEMLECDKTVRENKEYIFKEE